MSIQHRLFAAAYDTLLRPLERRELAPRRARLLAGLHGTVVDVGSGTGANLAHFRHAERVVLVEPDRFMRAKLARRLGVIHSGYCFRRRCGAPAACRRRGGRRRLHPGAVLCAGSAACTAGSAQGAQAGRYPRRAGACPPSGPCGPLAGQAGQVLGPLRGAGVPPKPEHGGSHRRGRFRLHGSQQVRGPGCCPGHADHRGYRGSAAFGWLSPAIRSAAPVKAPRVPDRRRCGPVRVTCGG